MLDREPGEAESNYPPGHRSQATEPSAPQVACSSGHPAVPHVILLTESPALQGAFSLACHLAHLASTASSPVLLVDLAPAASRIAQALAGGMSRFSHWRDAVQPLWVDSTHGRTLHVWKRSGAVDVVAQLGGEFPTASQMPRLTEQLVRQLAQPRFDGDGNSINYQYVFLLSEYAGVPLDLAAWRAADEIWVLHDPKQTLDTVASNLSARMGSAAAGSEQKLILVNKLAPKLADWARRQRLEVDVDNHPALAQLWPHHRSFNLTWPLLSGRLTHSLSRTARELWHAMSRESSSSRSDRQAS